MPTKQVTIQPQPPPAPTNGDAPTITREQIEQFVRHQQAAEQQAMQACIAKVQKLAAENGFEIMAMPLLTPDGRIGADWGVRRVAG